MKLPVGQAIAALRKQMSITQEALAASCHVTPQAVSRWEQGLSYPDLDLIPTLALFFGVTTDQLLGYREQDMREELAIKFSLTHNEADFEQAERVLLRSLDLAQSRQEELDCRRLLVHLYYQHSMAALEQAAASCQALIDRAQGVDQAQWLMASKQMVLLRHMQRRTAENRRRCQLGDHPSSDDYELHLVLLGELGEYEEILRVADAAIGAYGPKPAFLDEAATAALKLQRLDLAEQYAQAYLDQAQTPGEQGMAHRLFYLIYQAAGRERQAQQALRAQLAAQEEAGVCPSELAHFRGMLEH